ncbi:PH domain-containing protein [Acuticoccus sp. MNP-M23]|uniref:PH domain-containing protein n=1 Tax=Acuticoccus sp. MNP-M23 TaxID=3072793 RepID=UPI0028169384|nr:PH domain-containing protein [Acuticoccus sp. MNP-M23]WMS41238.1 PH domain-containing protein [Acuticoccus sp. MNP-M23]
MNDAPTVKPRYQEHPRMFADEPGRFILAVILIPVLVGIVWLVFWWIRTRCTLVTVGDERVLLSRGVFAKERLEIELKSIRTVEIDQTFVDRIFNCGILKIYTAGDNPELLQKGMPDPERLRSALRS